MNNYKLFSYNNGNIVYSVVVPVYNQENIIIENIKSIIHNTLGNFEIIIILDYCFDNTEQNIFTFLDNYKNEKESLVQIKVFINKEKPLFETKCDNIGFKNSEGKYCLEIQADMKMTEYGYNIHLTKPFLVLNNVIAVSGRCCHKLYDHSKGVGKMGMNIERTLDELKIDKNKFYVYETCNRGPLLLDKEKLKEMDFLDEEEYFLDDSDHDLMARAYLQKKYICGYVPIDFFSPVYLGSTRNTNNYEYCHEYYVNYNEKTRLINELSNKLGLKKYRSTWIDRRPIFYDISRVSIKLN